MHDPADQRPGAADAPLWDPTAVPAATVVVLRDGDEGLEVLMLRRDKDLSFAGGTWVFPGGRIDPGDHSPDDPAAHDPAAQDVGAGAAGPEADTEADMEVAARRAAVREAAEEAGLVLDPSSLRRWSHWTPPPQSPKRFTTAFFVAHLADGAAEVVIDDGEIREHQWRRPDDMLWRRDAGEVSLTPPTMITLHQLSPHADAASVLRADREVEHFATRIAVRGDTIVALYHGDAGYRSGDPDAPGPRHRLEMSPDGWDYVRRP